MAPRKSHKTKIRALETVQLQPGDPVWTYLRHSPGEDQTIFSQRVDLERFVRDGGLLVARWYVDEAKSGSTVDSRADFERMIADSHASPPPVKAVLIWDWGRFSRDDLESQLYAADLRLRGYEIVSIHDDIPRGEFGPVFEAFIRWKNRRYLLDLQAATLRGLDAVVRDRVVIDGVERTGFAAGGFPPRGYQARKVEVGTKPSGKPITRTYWVITTDPDLRARVEAAWAMALEAARLGLPPPVLEIHRRCGIFKDTQSYYDMLRTLTYTGARRVGERVVEAAHEAYITRADYELVQTVMPEGKRRAVHVHPRRVSSPMVLSGRVFCGYCGSTVNYDPDYRRVQYTGLRCCRRKNDSAACRLRKVNYQAFLDGIIDALLSDLLTPEALRLLLEELNRRQSDSRATLAEERSRAEKALVGVERAIERLLDALEVGDAPAPIRERLAQREREREQLASQVADLTRRERSARPRRIREEHLVALLQEMRSTLQEGDPTEVKELLESLVLRVELTNEGGRLFYSLPPLARDSGYQQYPVGDSNARTWLRRPVLYPLS